MPRGGEGARVHAIVDLLIATQRHHESGAARGTNERASSVDR